MPIPRDSPYGEPPGLKRFTSSDFAIVNIEPE